MRQLPRIALFAILPAMLAGLMAASGTNSGSLASDLCRQPRVRRPVAMVVDKDSLLIANQRGGSVSILDMRSLAVMSETPIGQRLSDLAELGSGQLLVCDEEAGELILLKRRGNDVEVAARLAVGHSPVAVCVLRDRSCCAVSLLWAHRIAIVDLAHDPGQTTMHLRCTIDLPFAPRLMCQAPDGQLLFVADSFAGNLAAIDVKSHGIRSLHSIEGNNIRGMILSADQSELLLSHPMLAQSLATNESNIFWGSLISDDVRAVKVSDLVAATPSEQPESIGHWSLYPLGEPGKGAGDPGGIVFTSDGTALVALSGVNQVEIGRLEDTRPARVDVGRRPTAIALDYAGRAFVANTLDDSISVIDVSSRRVISTVSLGPQPPLAWSDRGEQLFYDARLSHDGWFSCQTCHTDTHTCGLLNDNFSDNSFGTPKRILTLRGVGQSGPWAWNGSNPTLQNQIHKSILNTMNGGPERASQQKVAYLAAFLNELPPPPSLALARGHSDSPAAQRGKRIFQQWDCDHCHQPPAYTSPKTYDVGLADEAGMTRFNPPSLLGVSQIPRWFHDNRADSLRDVFLKYHHPHGREIPASEVDDLVAFLESL